ncbi:MAG: hypothetical protein M1826_006387 [Phylliscum demangeonii]|nr:MAG: hypothetical protein M1826_006387 [Phylliscum demangeonii]
MEANPIPISTAAVPAATGGPFISSPAVAGEIPAPLPRANIPAPNIPITIGHLNGQTQTIVFGGSSAALPAPIILGSQTYTPNSATQYVIEDQTLAVSSPITVGSGSSTAVVQLQATSDGTGPAGRTPIIVGIRNTAVQSNAAPIVIGDHTYSANTATQQVLQDHASGVGAPITVGSGASEVVILQQTPTQGADAAGQTPVVIGSSRTAVQANGAPLVVGGQTYSANSASQYVISGRTLALGSPITVGSGSSPTVIALQAGATDSATQVVVGAAVDTVGPSPTPPVLTIGDHTYTANAATEYVVAPGLTLTPGGSVVTLSGTPISLAPSASAVVVGSSTKTLAVPPLRTGGSGAGASGGGSTAKATSVAPLTGAASRLRDKGGNILQLYGAWLVSIAVACLLRL